MTALAVIDDHPVYREGLAAAITASGRWPLLGTYESVEEFWITHRTPMSCCWTFTSLVCTAPPPWLASPPPAPPC